MGLAELRAAKGLGAINDVYKTKAVEKEIRVKPGRAPKPPNPESEKMKDTKTMLKKLYALFLAKRKLCAIKSPDCTKDATVVHHKAGRGKLEIMDQSTWLESCESCNSYVESNDAWARKNGFKISKHTKQ